jgi:heme oxygenase
MVQEDLKNATLQEELKSSTTKSHQALEKKMLKVIKGIKSKGDYVKFLKLMYGFHAAMEKELERYMPYIQVGNRRLAYRLLNDIKQFEPVKKVEMCRELPAIDSLASALGAMYVLEGSVMGAPHIVNMITSQLKLHDSSSLTFFTGQGEDMTASWKIFLTNFNRDFEDDERRAIIRSATTTFEMFSHWIEENT